MKIGKYFCIIIVVISVAAFLFSKKVIVDTDLSRGKIVFSSCINGRYEIYTMKLDGSDLKKLIKDGFAGNYPGDSEPSFSSDGKKIVFASRQEAKKTEYRMGSLGGRLIADICVVNSDGNNLRSITDGEYFQGPLFFSPDGSRIIYGTRVGKYVGLGLMNVDGSGRRLLNSRGGIVKFSRDGRQMFDNFQGSILTAYNSSFDRKTVFNYRDIATEETGHDNSYSEFDVAPDAKKIVAVREEKTIKKEGKYYKVYRFYSIDAESSKVEEIYKKDYVSSIPGFLHGIRLSPDSERVMFIEDWEKWGIYALDLASHSVKNITDLREEWSSILDFAFTPDGRRIVFVADVYPRYYFFHAVILHNIKAFLRYLILGKQTPFYDNKYICVMDIDGSNYRRISRLPLGTELGHDFIHFETK